MAFEPHVARARPVENIQLSRQVDIHREETSNQLGRSMHCQIQQQSTVFWQSDKFAGAHKTIYVEGLVEIWGTFHLHHAACIS